MIVTTSSTTTATNIELATAEDLVIAAGVLRASTSGVGVEAAALGHCIDILGTVSGSGGGIVLGPFTGGLVASQIAVADGGAVLSVNLAVTTRGDDVAVFNAGYIRGRIGLDHLFGESFALVNTGTILGSDGFGVEVNSPSGRIVNHGLIEGQGAEGVRLRNTDGAGVAPELVNFGTIGGQVNAVTGDAALADEVVNNGRLVGAVVLGGGNDLYDGRNGTITGVVWGDAGADTLLGGGEAEQLFGFAGLDSLDGGGGRDLLAGGTEADTLDGGEGDDILRGEAGGDVIDGGAGAHDLLDYAASLAVTVNLALREASGGFAQGDVFAGIEWLAGGGGADLLTGDAVANALFGRLGNDVLAGGGGDDLLAGDTGNDTLTGGAGVDVLRGGVGADNFRFVAPSDSGAPGSLRDRIMDFSKAQADDIDLSAIDAHAGLAGNQAFAFVGAAAFSAAGQVRAQVIGGNTFVFGNTDAGLATSEFSILLVGAVTLAASDFVL